MREFEKMDPWAELPSEDAQLMELLRNVLKETYQRHSESPNRELVTVIDLLANISQHEAILEAFHLDFSQVATIFGLIAEIGILVVEEADRLNGAP